MVFVVDEDDAVRDAVATSLRAAGFAVAAFASARQFLEVYRVGQRGCLIVDADHPDGENELLRMLATSELALPAIVTSRRLRRRTLAPALTALPVLLLEKPFGVDDLLPLISAVIALGGDPD